MSIYVEAFNGADGEATEQDDLVWKEILREDEFRFTPTADGVRPVPFRVVRQGPSSSVDRTISMADVKSAFDAKAYEHVQVPLTDEAGKDHKDIARINTGFVDRLEVRDGSDGKAGLWAGIRFTEPEVKGKVMRGTIANCSSGVWFDRVRPSDGAKFPVALRHVALTNTPFATGLKPFGVAMSEEDGVDPPDETYSVALADDEVVWSPNESFARLQNNISSALAELAKSDNPEGIEDPNATILFPRDIWTTKVLAEDMRDGKTVVIPFKRKKDSVDLAPKEEWTQADQQWIAASEDSFTRAAGRVAFQTLVRDAKEAQAAADEERQRQNEANNVAASEDPAPRRRASTPAERLRAAQEGRNARLREPDHKNHRGGARSMGALTSAVDLSALELSDEQRSALEPVLAENERLRKERHEESVNAEVQRVMDLGLSENTGFVKLYRRLLLADDGGAAAIVLSEDGSRNEEVTLTDALKQMINALPKNSEGKIVLSDQQLLTEAGVKPDAESKDEQEDTDEQAIEDTRKRLGLPV